MLCSKLIIKIVGELCYSPEHNLLHMFVLVSPRCFIASSNHIIWTERLKIKFTYFECTSKCFSKVIIETLLKISRKIWTNCTCHPPHKTWASHCHMFISECTILCCTMCQLYRIYIASGLHFWGFLTCLCFLNNYNLPHKWSDLKRKPLIFTLNVAVYNAFTIGQKYFLDILGRILLEWYVHLINVYILQCELYYLHQKSQTAQTCAYMWLIFAVMS